MSKIYKEFKAKQIRDKVVIITNDGDELILAEIPSHIKNQLVVAKALAETLTKSKLALTDLI